MNTRQTFEYHTFAFRKFLFGREFKVDYDGLVYKLIRLTKVFVQYVMRVNVLIIILYKMRVIICVKVYPFIVFIYLFIFKKKKKEKVNKKRASDFN